MDNFIKILPMAYSPVRSYHYYTDLLSVILNHENSENWLYNNFIQLYAPPLYENRNDFNILNYYFPYSVWKSCPLIYYQRVTSKFVKGKWANIIDFLIYCINQDYYIYIDYDRYYIKMYNNNNNYHLTHDMFIYGYDVSEKKFYITEFVGKGYSYLNISFDELEQAYNSSNQEEHNPNGVVNGLELISYYGRDNELNVDYIKQSILDYLNADNPYNRVIPDDRWKYFYEAVVYGTGVYNNIYYYLKTYLKQDPDAIDTHPLHILHEHKKIMLMRIKYLAGMGHIRHAQYIYTSFKKVERLALIAKNQHTKYSLAKDSKLLDMISQLVNQIELLERPILFFLVQNIHKKYDLQPVIIDETLDDYPFIFSATVKKHETTILSNTDLLSNDTLSWTNDNTDICEIDSETIEQKRKTLLHCKKAGEAFIKAVNEKGDVKMIGVIHFIESGFKTNFQTLKTYEGQWVETEDGLVGKGDHEFILFHNAFNYFIYETEVVILDKSGAPGVIFKSSRDFDDFYCICLDAVSGCATLWKPKSPNLLASVHAGIETNKKYCVKIHSKGNNVVVYLNGNMLLEYDNVNLRDGYFGLMATGESLFQNTFFYTVQDENVTELKNNNLTTLPNNAEAPGFCGHVGIGAHFFHSHENKTISSFNR